MSKPDATKDESTTMKKQNVEVLAPERMAEITARIDAAAGLEAAITQTPAPVPAPTPIEPPDVADIVNDAKAGIDAMRRKLDMLERAVIDQAANTSWSMHRLAEVGSNALAECERMEKVVHEWMRQLPPPANTGS